MSLSTPKSPQPGHTPIPPPHYHLIGGNPEGHNHYLTSSLEIQWFSPQYMLSTVALIKEPPRGAWAVCGLQEGPSWLRILCVCDGRVDLLGGEMVTADTISLPASLPPFLLLFFSSFSGCFHWYGKRAQAIALLMSLWGHPTECLRAHRGPNL